MRLLLPKEEIYEPIGKHCSAESMLLPAITERRSLKLKLNLETTMPEAIRPMKAAAWMDRSWPEGGNAFSEYAAFVEEKGALDPKTRALILLVATSLQRCPHCVDHHLETLKKLGATNSEIAEAMMLGSVAAAGANMAWAAEVFHKRLFH